MLRIAVIDLLIFLQIFSSFGDPAHLTADSIDLCLVPLQLSLVLYGLWHVEDLLALPNLSVHLLWEVIKEVILVADLVFDPD